MKRLLVILLLNVAMLLGLGVVAQYSACTGDLEPERLRSHLWHIATGVGWGCLAAVLPYGWLRRHHLSSLLFGLAVGALVAVYIPGIGVEINHARRWLRWGVQPSAFAQLALIVALAHYGAKHRRRMLERDCGFLRPGVMAGTVVVLIYFEPDWGTAILLMGVTAVMLFVSGTHWGYLLAGAIVAGELLAISFCFTPEKLQRLLCFMDPEKFQHGLGWQGWASVMSLGVGGWWGCRGGGLLKYQYVPEQDTDFILSRFGEEHGFLGTMLVLLNYVSLVAVGLCLAWRTRDRFAQLLAVGLTCLVGFQAFINIGVTTSSLPNKGIVLPYMSLGGSALWALLMAVGLLVSVGFRGPAAGSAEVSAEDLSHEQDASIGVNSARRKSRSSPFGLADGPRGAGEAGDVFG